MSEIRRTIFEKSRAALALLLLSEALAGCKAKSSAQKAALPSASAEKVLEAPRTLSDEDVQKMVNPEKRPPYSGAVGSVKGIVRLSGDDPPEDRARMAKIPAAGECRSARETYGKSFRVGPDRALADVLVGVTGYEDYLPARGEGTVVTVRDCAFDTRTIALMFGQRIKIVNKGGQACIPELMGQPYKALLVAMPGAEPLTLEPSKVGHYALVDNSHAYATADVFVIRYPTFDVTGLDGKFEVDKLPPGELKVSAYLPALGKTVERTVNIVAGQAAELELEIAYDAAKDTVRGVPKSQPAPSAAAPSAKASGTVPAPAPSAAR